jgi:PAS domain S-box-containing protein
MNAHVTFPLEEEPSGIQGQAGPFLRRTRFSPRIVLGAYLVLFILLQRAAAHLAPAPAVSVWYFPAALSLALLLLLGPAYAPALAVAAFLGNLVLALPPVRLPVSLAALNALAHAAGYGLVALGFRRSGLSPRLRRLPDVAGFLLAAVAGPMLVAAPAVLALRAGAQLGPLSAFTAFHAFWLGDTLGILTLGPFLLVWILPPVRGGRPASWRPWRPEHRIEAAFQSAALALGALATVDLSTPGTLHLKYVLFLPLLWVALRGGTRALSLAIPFLTLSLLALLAWKGGSTSLLIDAQAFLGVLFGTALLMGAATDDQASALRAQARHTARLNQLVDGTGALPWEMHPETGRPGRLDGRVEALLGWPRQAWLVRPFWGEVVHPDDLPAFRRFCRETRQSGTGHQMDLRFRTPEGGVRWMRAQAGLDPAPDRTLVMGFLFDIHAQKQAEEARHRFFQMTGDLLAIWDAQGRLRDLNPAWEAQLGYPQGDLLGRPVLDLVHPEDRDLIRTLHGQLAGSGGPLGYEGRFRARDGTYRWLLWTATALPDLGLAYGVARDITERKGMELRLRASEARYRSTLAALEEGVVLRDAEGRILSRNVAAERILDGEPWLMDGPFDEGMDVIREDGTPLRAEELPPLRALRSGEPVPGTVFGFRRKDGHRTWIRVAAQPLVADGAVQGVVCSLDDVTAQRAALEALHHSERELRSILDTLPDMIFHLDARGTFLGLRTPNHEQLVQPPEAFLGRTVAQVLPGLADPTLAAIRTCLQEGRPQSFRYTLPDAAGTERHYEARVIPHRADEVLAIVRDISDFKRHEESIQVALREKEVLLKEIHHRVKNNLQVVSSLLRLQAGSHPEPAVQAALQEAQERIQAIALIHQKLKHAPDPTRLDLPTYVETLVERLVRSYASTPALVDLQIRVDPIRLGPDEAVPLGLVLNELVTNALQHAFLPGQGGSLEIDLEGLPEGQALLRVADSGGGLPEGTDLEHGGLGFQLVRALADQLDGTLELERRRGAAIRLTFTPRPGPGAVPHES